MLDTNIVILRKWVDPAELPAEIAISAKGLPDLMIAVTAIGEGLPLFTTNPDDFAGLLCIIPVTRPPLPDDKPARV